MHGRPQPVSQTAGRILESRALISGGLCAVAAEGDRVTFAELEQRANRLAHLLRDMGIGKSDRVGLLMPNGLPFIEFFYATAKIGAVCCGLNHRLSASELGAIIRESELSLLVVDQAFGALAAAVLSGHEPAMRVVDPADPAASHHRRLTEFPATPPHTDVHPDDTLLLVYTSGTTGRPKAAMITHDQLFWSSLTMSFSLDCRIGDVHLLPVPMFHVGGLSFISHCVHLGATLVVPARWNPEQVARLIREERVNHFFAVPTMLLDLLALTEVSADWLQSVRWILTGAAPTPPTLIRRFGELGVPVMQSYGATETCGPGLFVDQANALEKAGSVGRPFFHTECRLVSDGGLSPGAGEHGELLLRGRHVFAGYRNDPDATKQAFTEDGWLRTGDVGYADQDGFIYLVDRRKNLIISGGENIYPREVEQVIEAHSDVLEVAVVGKLHDRLGEVACAAVVLKPGADATVESLTAFCAENLARYKVPREVYFVDSLPRNATGKLVRERIAAFTKS